MTTGQKIQQFKDYYLGGTIAVIAVAALIIFMVTRFLSPAEDEAALRVAVFDTELSSEALEKLEQAVRASLNLPEDARIVVDTGFVSTNTNEYARLSVLAADGRVDAVIAGEEAFAELAGYGYFKDLSLCMPEDLKSACAEDLRAFKYNSDVIAEDAQQNGELASGEYHFGLSLSGSSLWNSMTADSVVKPEKAVLGVILESENDANIEGLIRALLK
jgi:hypothetical protein